MRSISTAGTAVGEVDQTSVKELFRLLAQRGKLNPPLASNHRMMPRKAGFGIAPGEPSVGRDCPTTSASAQFRLHGTRKRSRPFTVHHDHKAKAMQLQHDRGDRI